MQKREEKIINQMSDVMKKQAVETASLNKKLKN